MSLRIVVITAGVSRPSATRRLADRLSQAVSAELTGANHRSEVRVIEVRQLAHDTVDLTLTGHVTQALADAHAAVEAADGIIAVTPVFMAAPAGIFKSFFDSLDKSSLVGKPVLLGATGGTDRHALVIDFGLRPMFAFLHADVVPTAVFATPRNWVAGSAEESLARRVRSGAAELAARLTTRIPAPARAE